MRHSTHEDAWTRSLRGVCVKYQTLSCKFNQLINIFISRTKTGSRYFIHCLFAIILYSNHLSQKLCPHTHAQTQRTKTGARANDTKVVTPRVLSEDSVSIFVSNNPIVVAGSIYREHIGTGRPIPHFHALATTSSHPLANITSLTND